MRRGEPTGRPTVRVSALPTGQRRLPPLQPHLLFELEHVLIKVLLQALVAVVDAELVQPVLLEYLETKDVEDADEGSGRCWGRRPGLRNDAPPRPPPKKNTFFSVRTAKASVRRDRRHRRVATCGMRLVRPVRPVCPGRH